MTHETIECPNPELTTRQCLRKRSEYAAEYGADLLISMHNNAGRNISGFEIYYPNANYITELNIKGEQLSQKIADELKNIGLNELGLYTRDSDEDIYIDENFYPDGTRADYYNIIRNAKYNNILGIIVEHAYLSNEYDAQLLSDDNVLTSMGIADANAIAHFYYLNKR